MVPATQHELIEKLADVQQLSPDARFARLLANLGFLVEDQTDQSLWEVEDARLLEVIEYWQASREGGRRGIVEIVGEGS